MEYARFHRFTNYEFFNSTIKSIVLSPGDSLFKRGINVNEVYFFVKGEINLIRKDVVVSNVTENNFIGLIPFLLNDSYNEYSIEAMMESVLIIIDFKIFNLAITKSNYLWNIISDSFCKRRAEVLMKIDFRGVNSSKKRIVFFIKKKFLIKSKGGVVMYVNKNVAKEIGVKESYLIKYLKELTSKRIIYYFNKSIEVIDSKGLDLLMEMTI